MLQERNLPLKYAYFLEDGAASLTARAGDCLPVEIQTIGAKDFIGIPLILECVSPLTGASFRFRAERCK